MTVIFENEKECEQFLKSYFYIKATTVDIGDIIDIETSLIEIKADGYIRKSPIEEAEEIYSIIDLGYVQNTSYLQWECITAQHKAIQYLKAENERLKK